MRQWLWVDHWREQFEVEKITSALVCRIPATQVSRPLVIMVVRVLEIERLGYGASGSILVCQVDRPSIHVREFEYGWALCM
jgi:hypothetical protein